MRRWRRAMVGRNLRESNMKRVGADLGPWQEIESNTKVRRQGDAETGHGQLELLEALLRNGPTIGWIYGVWSQWEYIRLAVTMGKAFVKIKSPTGSFRIIQIGGVQRRSVAFGGAPSAAIRLAYHAGGGPGARTTCVSNVWLFLFRRFL